MLDEIMAHVYKHWKILCRRPGESAWILVYPFIGVLSIGIYTLFIVSQGAPMASMMLVFVGVQVWNFYDITQRAVTYGMTFDIWSKSMKHAFVAKASMFHFIAGNALFGLLSAAAAFVLVGLLGIAIFGFNVFGVGIFALNLVPVFLFAIGVGLMINSLIVTKGEKYMSLIWTITGVIMIFSGVYYPASVLPEPFHSFAYVLPSTYAIDSMRAAFSGADSAYASMGIGLVLSVAYLLAGILAFREGIRRGKVNGMITKY